MIKQPFYEADKISLEITTCLEATTFLRIINSSKVTSLLKVIVFLAEIAYSARNSYVKGVNIKTASIEGACIKTACNESVCIRDASTCAGSTCIRVWNANIRDDFIGDICVRYTNSIEPLWIHSQSSWILELIRYSLALKTKIGTSWVGSHSIRLKTRVEVSWVGRYSIELETGVKVS